MRAALAAALSASLCQAIMSQGQQHVFSPGRPKYTLENTKSLTHAASGEAKFCPEETCSTASPCARRPQCVPLSKPACPPGVELNGRVCVTEATPYCPPPTVFQDKACVSKIPSCVPRQQVAILSQGKPIRLNDEALCVRAETPCPEGTLRKADICVSVGGPSCPEYTTFNPKTQSCTLTQDPSCPPDELFENGQCHSVSTPGCEPSTQLSLDRVSNTARCCPFGMIWDGEVCVVPMDQDGNCLSGLIKVGTRCEKQTITPSVCPPSFKPQGRRRVSREPPECPPGYTRDGTLCSSTESPQCPVGYQLKCPDYITTENTSCPEGTKVEGDDRVSVDPACELEARFDGANCVMDTPECVVGNHFNDKDCVTTNLPSCTPGSIFNGHRPPVCDKGLIYDGNQCVTIDNPACRHSHNWVSGECVNMGEQSCEPGYTLRNGKCVLDVRPECEPSTSFDSTAYVGGEPSYPRLPSWPLVQCIKWNAASRECVGSNGEHCALASGDSM
ncbi:hypothetical protein BDV29DRAFT_188522 [Aspergillus leporis]|uniref:Oocyst wall protein n=1 Tax=Aspergillus leporis TaxID=41062 RepID=A0A5N5XA67_9EURO|nr:hypothetical protein BDV29DRAFT_188522 [Aspergillus leporis]